jgi:ABC-type lipoprotein release transport system permease subunit
MRALRFAWRSLVRQPARAALGILGVAAVGALLFDMLMLSDGLIVSMRDLLDRTGYDIRVTAAGDIRRSGDRMHDAEATLRAIGQLPSVGAVLAIRFADAEADVPDETARTKGAGTTDSGSSTAQQGTIAVTMQGVLGDGRPWTVLEGRDPEARGEIVASRALAEALRLQPGDEFTLRARCVSRNEVLPPVKLRVAGIAEFPFELVGDPTAGGPMAVVDAACASESDEADIILASARGEVADTAAAIRAAQPRLSVATNEQVLGRLQRNGFTYFRQISAVLTTVTLGFALLLITVLLTVSVNQRLGEIAALRALGFSRRRVVADVLCESVLIVGLGGLASLPLGTLLAQGLDGILKAMPGIPGQMNFFVFAPATLGLHAALLGATAVAAALYPMQIVARLPIAATLRNEVLS